MGFYPLFVFEVDNLSSSIQSIEDAINLVKRLRKEEDESANLPPDPRFIRLGQLLAWQLPDEEGNFWLVRPEVTLSKNKRSGSRASGDEPCPGKPAASSAPARAPASPCTRH
jgi:hypothetical protein